MKIRIQFGRECEKKTWPIDKLRYFTGVCRKPLSANKCKKPGDLNKDLSSTLLARTVHIEFSPPNPAVLCVNIKMKLFYTFYTKTIMAECFMNRWFMKKISSFQYTARVLS